MLFTHVIFAIVLGATSLERPESDQERFAADAASPGDVMYRHFLGARYNPVGLVSELMVGYRHRLPLGEGALLNDTYVGAFLHTKLSPACAAMGGTLEAQPLAVLQLRVSYHNWRLFAEDAARGCSHRPRRTSVIGCWLRRASGG